MTCIVGIESNGTVIIGGDSAGTSGFDVMMRSDPKVFHNGPFLIGYTSSFRMGQLLRFRLSVPEQHADVDDFEFMATEFIDAVRHCFGEYGYRKAENEVQEGGTFLVGYRGKLYQVEGDFQVGIPLVGFAAVGCGESYALGSMATSAFALDNLTPRERVELALDTAVQFSAGVRGPFVIEELPAE